MRLRAGNTPFALVLVLLTSACGGKTLTLGALADAEAASASTGSSGTGTTGSGSTSATGAASSSQAGLDAAQALADVDNAAPDAARCGDPGEPCCLGASCNGGGCCVQKACVGQSAPCGHSLGACTNGSCGACGAVGQPCCDAVEVPSCSSGPSCSGCTAANAVCQGEQRGATCVACGGDGQPCCSGLACTGKYSRCVASPTGNEGTCTSRCGQIGQDCCSNDFGNESALACRNGAVCLWQTTGRQTTATGGICVDPSTCGYSNGKCTTCGVEGTPCCGGAACVPGEGLACFLGTLTCQMSIPPP
jgi:hypothetical protein